MSRSIWRLSSRAVCTPATLALRRGGPYGAPPFCSMLETERAGRHNVAFCTNISCWLNGAEDLVAHRQFDAREAHWAQLLAASSRPQAPWHILPADHKWLRDLLLASLLARQFEGLDQRWPDPPLPFDLDALGRA